ncbi:MAG TPA: xanthine dehydrogenase small subunit [Bacteroidota bacterium]|jgi:xanthine dehydrogenase small subunit
MQSTISFVLDGELRTIDFQSSEYLSPTTTVLNYLRGLPGHRGVKEGCAEGDCGACTVVLGEAGSGDRIAYKSIDSCLVFLPMLHGKQLITVENLRDPSGALHPVQKAMVETDGSQCGYCTPGFIMSLFSLYKNSDHPSRGAIDDALTGNLCRCTGYRPIIEAASESCVHNGTDRFTSDEPRIAGLLRSIPAEAVHIETGRQRYLRPATLAEALSLKHQRPGATVICGATDIALRVTKGHELLKEIIDLSDVPELKAVTEAGPKSEGVTIGAAVSLSEILDRVGPRYPALESMLTVFGSRQIRNLATLGGNLGTASPIGDTLPVLLAYDARVVLESLNGRREIPAREFITGYRKTVRKPDELITAVILPPVPRGAVIKSYKVSKRKDLDISTVSGAFRLELDARGSVSEIVAAYGGMADHVKRAAAAEEFLAGKKWERDSVEQALPLVEGGFSPISDARAGAEFRRVAARNLLMKFWWDTTEKGPNNGPNHRH